MITINDFSKVELKVGTVLEADYIEGSDRLLKLKVDLGEEQSRQILSGIKEWYKPEQLIGKQFIFVANLEPRIMMGLESQGMILCAESNSATTFDSGAGDERPIPLKPASKVPAGSKIR